MKSNLQIAQSIAESVYEMQIDSESFYSIESKLGEDIPVKFSENVLSNDSFKSVIIMRMVSNIMMDMVRMPIYFKERHTDEDGHVGYHPDDREYDEEMIKFVQRVFEDEIFTEVMEDALPKTEYEVTGTFSFTGKIKVKASSMDEAIELAGSRGNEFPDVSDVEDTCSGWVVTEAIEII